MSNSPDKFLNKKIEFGIQIQLETVRENHNSHNFTPNYFDFKKNLKTFKCFIECTLIILSNFYPIK